MCIRLRNGGMSTSIVFFQKAERHRMEIYGQATYRRLRETANMRIILILVDAVRMRSRIKIMATQSQQENHVTRYPVLYIDQWSILVVSPFLLCPVPIRRLFRLDPVDHASLEPGGSDSLGLEQSSCGRYQ